MLVNCAPFLPKLVVKEIGIAPSSWVILQLTTQIYLKQVTGEQFQARVTPKKAPFFSDKLLLLSNHLKMRLALPTLNASEQFVTASDKAFFKTLLYSGDRAGGLGR